MNRDRYWIEGHAIISTDGMIADANGGMPPALMNDADWALFQASLDASAVTVLGRAGHLRHPNRGRKRLVFTTSVERFAFAEGDPLSLYVNPQTGVLADALVALGIHEGHIAVAGGRRVFDHFLGQYDCFVLSEQHQLVLEAGVPCFSAGHARSVLAKSGLVPSAFSIIDPAANVTQTMWRR